MFLRIMCLLGLIVVLPAIALAQQDDAKQTALPFENGFVFDVPFDGLKPETAPYALAQRNHQAIHDPVIIKDQQFVTKTDGKEIRFWGTNLCYSACFLPHDVSDRLVKRLQSLGINIIRFHHMDQRPYPGGIWDRDAKHATNKPYSDIDPSYHFEHRKLDTEALDRLDYLIAQLKKAGIRVNLNLKVSREYGSIDGFPAADDNQMMPRRGRGLDFFYQPMIDAQKQYAQMLLGHVNAYTGLSYADDPVIAMVEINNENGLVYGWNLGMLDRLPQDCHQALIEKWNHWLKAKYTNTAALIKAWGQDADGDSGNDLLAKADVKNDLKLAGGKATLEQGSIAGEVEAADENRDLKRIVIEQSGGSAWRVRYRWTSLKLAANKHYLLQLNLRANTPQNIKLSVRRSDDADKTIGPGKRLSVTTQWQRFEIPINTPADHQSGSSQILMDIGYDGLVLDMGQAVLQSTDPIGLPMHQGIDEKQQVAWPSRTETAMRNEAFQIDAMTFLRQTEIKYWQEMKDYLRHTLGVQSCITGTATGHTTPQIAAESVDFLDTHRYWGSPKFSKARYDRRKWSLEHQAMVNTPQTSTIMRLSGRRVFGMPFTVTEYNHPQPNDYAAEGFPIIAVYGAYQNWQGIFQFAYSHNTQTIEQHGLAGSFFDLSGNPMQLALMPGCSAIFQNKSVPQAQSMQTAYVPVKTQLEKQMLRGYPRLVESVAYDGGIQPDAWMTSAIGLVRDSDQLQPSQTPSNNQPVKWAGFEQQRGHIVFTGTDAAGLIGFVNDQPLDLGWLKLQSGNTSLNGFAVILLNAVDGQMLGSSGRYLITAVTRCANRNMGWDKDRSTFGTQWGDLPTLVEAVPMTVSLANKAKLYPLSADGSRRDMLPVKENQKVKLDASHQTLWYELVIE
jgi:hypothetical protein